MANRKKAPDKKASEGIFVRVNPGLKDDVDAMAEDTGVPTSERVRVGLEEDVRLWKAGKLASPAPDNQSS